MNPRVLLIVTGDPRVSPRPAEAIRIAAGVGVWQKADIALYLRDAAVLALSESAEEFVDEDHYTRYLPMLGSPGHPVYVQRGAAQLDQLGAAPVRFEEIDDAQLAALAARSDSVAHF